MPISALLSSPSLQCPPPHILCSLHSVMSLTGSPSSLHVTCPFQPCFPHDFIFSAMSTIPYLLFSSFSNVPDYLSFILLYYVSISTLLPSPSLQCPPPHIFCSLHSVMPLTSSPSSFHVTCPFQPSYNVYHPTSSIFFVMSPTSSPSSLHITCLYQVTDDLFSSSSSCSVICLQEIVELQSRIDELRNFKKDAESKLPDFVNVAAEKGDLEDQLRSLQKVGFG